MKTSKIGANPYFLSFPSGIPRLQWWIWLVGTFAIGALTILGALVLLPFIYLLPLEWQLPLDPDFPRSGYADTLLLWLSFIPAFLAPFLIYKLLHRLPLRRLISFSGKIDWSRMIISFLIIVFGYSIISGAEYLFRPEDYEGIRLHEDWPGFFILFGLTLIFLPFQSASEEILCRGYLNQALSLITKQPWIAFVITSAFFALLHLANPEAEGQVGPYMVDTFIFGMAMCWLSYEDQGLESAIGFHIGNNLFVFALLGYADPILPQSAILMAPEPVITWKDTLEGAVYTLGLTFLIIHTNRLLDKRRQRLQANA